MGMGNIGNIAQAALNGWMKGSQYRQNNESDAEDRAWRKEQRESERSKVAEEKSLRRDLATAARPVEVVEGANGAVLPETMDNRDVGAAGEAPLAAQGAYRVGSKTVDSPEVAANMASSMSSPTAIAGRQAKVYAERGMPEKAASLEDRQLALQKHAQELKEKGVLSGLADFRRGNVEGATKALKASGMYDIDGDVSMAPRELDVPGVGKIKTYDLSFNAKVGGKVVPTVVNSHEASLMAMPYEKALEFQRKGTKDETQAANQEARLNMAQQRLELQGALNEARIAKMQAGGGGGKGGGEKADREYRLLLQQQTTNVGKEVRELDALIKHAQDNSTKSNPDPRLKDMMSERSQLVARRAALNDEFANLAEKKAPGSENLAQSRALKVKETPRGKMVQVKSAADYERLPSGSLYIDPNGNEKRKK